MAPSGTNAKEFGGGGDGGESNSPSRKGSGQTSTGLVAGSFLAASRLRLYAADMGAVLSCEQCDDKPRVEPPLTLDRRLSRSRPACARRSVRLAGLGEC